MHQRTLLGRSGRTGVGSVEMELINHWLDFMPYYLASTPWSLLLLPLLSRWIPHHHAASADTNKLWEPGIELLIALLSGCSVMLLNALLFSDYYYPRGGVSSSDFEQYCSLTGFSQFGGVSPHHYDRFRVSSFLPGWLAVVLGVVDGLAVSNLLSAVGMGAGLYLWGRVLHSRLAGISAALLMCTTAPLVGLSRAVTFYPQWAALFVLSAAFSCLAMQRRTWITLVLGSTAVGLSLLIDVRGVLWSLAPIAVLLLAALREAPANTYASQNRPGEFKFGRIQWLSPAWMRRCCRLLCVVGPLALSAQTSKRYNHPTTTPLQMQVRSYVQDSKRLTGLQQSETLPGPGPQSNRGFVWGHSSLFELPGALLALVDLAEDNRMLAVQKEVTVNRTGRVLPWLPVILVCAAICSWMLRTQPWLLFAFWATAGTFFGALWKTSQVFLHMRMLGLSYAAIPLVMGIAYAVLVLTPLPKLPLPARLRQLTWTRVRPVVAFGVLYFAVQGNIPTFIAPVAPWRMATHDDTAYYDILRLLREEKHAARLEERECIMFLQQDAERGIPPEGRILPELMKVH